MMSAVFQKVEETNRRSQKYDWRRVNHIVYSSSKDSERDRKQPDSLNKGIA